MPHSNEAAAYIFSQRPRVVGGGEECDLEDRTATTLGCATIVFFGTRYHSGMFAQTRFQAVFLDHAHGPDH